MSPESANGRGIRVRIPARLALVAVAAPRLPRCLDDRRAVAYGRLSSKIRTGLSSGSRKTAHRPPGISVGGVVHR